MRNLKKFKIPEASKITKIVISISTKTLKTAEKIPKKKILNNASQ